MTIAQSIRALREVYGLSQLELGHIAGVSDKAVSSWENGAKTPRMEVIQKISDHFNIPKSQIIDGDWLREETLFAPQTPETTSPPTQEAQAPQTTRALMDMFLDVESRKMVDRYSTLSVDKQRQAQEFIRFLASDDSR